MDRVKDMMNHSDNEDDEVVVETEAMRSKALEQLDEAIAMLPQEDRASLERAKQTAPQVFETESDPLLFLRFHSFNSWATAKRITTYWSFREGIFGERAFLPLDLSGKGAMSLEDVRMLHTGCLMFLPFDLKGRSVLYIDRSKLLEDEKISSRLLFFCIQRIMQNKMSQTSGSVALVNLSTPFGATFQTDNMALAKDLIRKGMPMKAEGEIHVVCTPPLQGRNSFVSSFLPLCLKRFGSFFSKFVQPHIADSEEDVFYRLQQHNLSREGLPPCFGGTWNGFDGWLISENSRLERNPHLDVLVRNALWAYKETVGSCQDSGTTENTRDALTLAAEESLIQDRKAYAHFDIRDYTNEQHRGMSPEERESILRDIYGTAEVPFTFTREVEMECRARQQFDEAMLLLPSGDAKDYLEAKKQVPHLIELESDPLRYLRIEKFNTWNAARRVALYWRNRKEVFGERAFFPLALSGKSALKEEEIAMIKTGYMAVMPDDQIGRPIYFHDLSRLTVSFTGESRTRCAFYIMNLISERESSRNAGAIGMAVYGSKAPKGATNPKHGRKATEMARDGVFPCHWRAIHVCAVGVKTNTLRDRYFVPFTLQMLRRWKALSLRTIVHVDQTPEGIRSKIAEYGISGRSVPFSVGGLWSYDVDFKNWISERIEYEKDVYWSFEQNKETQSVGKVSVGSSPSQQKEADAAVRDKKRKMDALYARRKRERQRIEIEVLQEQCFEYNNKNSAIMKQNKWLESLLKKANTIVQLHADGAQNNFGDPARRSADHAFGAQMMFHEQKNCTGL